MLDLKHPVPESSLDLVMPLSVLYGCNMVPVGGHIQINAILRIGSPEGKEKSHKVCLNVTKDAYNMGISISDKGNKLFKENNQYYCIVTGKKPRRKSSGLSDGESEEESEESDADECETPVRVKQEPIDDDEVQEESGAEVEIVKTEAKKRGRKPGIKVKVKQEVVDDTAEDSTESQSRDTEEAMNLVKSKSLKVMLTRVPVMSIEKKDKRQRRGGTEDQDKSFTQNDPEETPAEPVKKKRGRKRKIQPEESEKDTNEEDDVPEPQDDDTDRDWSAGKLDVSLSSTETPTRRFPSRSNRMSRLLGMKKEFEIGIPSIKKEGASPKRIKVESDVVEKGSVGRPGRRGKHKASDRKEESSVEEVVETPVVKRRGRKPKSVVKGTADEPVETPIAEKDATSMPDSKKSGTKKHREREISRDAEAKTPQRTAKVIRSKTDDTSLPEGIDIPPVISVDGKLYLTGNPFTGTPAVPLESPVAATSQETIKAESENQDLEDKDVEDGDGDKTTKDMQEESSKKSEITEALQNSEEGAVKADDALNFDDMAIPAELVQEADHDTGGVTGDDSFIESLLEHNYMRDEDQQEILEAVGISETADVEAAVAAEEDIPDDSDADASGDSKEDAKGDEEYTPSDEESTSKGRKKTAQKKKRASKAPTPKGGRTRKTKKGEDKKSSQDGYFIQVAGQLYFVNGQADSGEAGKGKKKVVNDYDDDKYYPFTVAGIEIHKGFRHKTFTAEQKKTLSRALEPEKMRATVCPLCKLIYVNKLSVHLRLHHSEEEEARNMLRHDQLLPRLEEIIKRFSEKGTQLDIKCPFCREDLSSFEMIEHLTSKHDEILKEDALISRDSMCDMIKNHEKKPWIEEPHMARLRKVVSSHMAICPFCQKPQGRRSLFYHLNNYCPGNVLKDDHYTCKECMHISITEEEFTAHHEKFHSKQRFVCQFCATVFQRKQMFYQHLRLVHKHGRRIPKEPVPCPVPGCKYKTFHAKRLKVHHERRHAKEMAHLCEHCGASFKCKAYLTNHYMKQHPDLKRYICRRCKRRFCVYEAYRRHETCCFDLADPNSQIDFKKADIVPLKPEECSDEELPVPEPAPKKTAAKANNVKQEPDEAGEATMTTIEGVAASALQQLDPQAEYMYILQDESAVGDWSALENVAQVAAAQSAGDNTVLTTQVEAGGPAPITIIPEQEYVSETQTMIVDTSAAEESGETVGIDSQELLKLCGSELGDFPPGTEILVYMDGNKGGEATKIQVLQQE